jgi:hypothetical protein
MNEQANDLAAVLRRLLREEASRVQPADDGLQRIRARILARRPRGPNHRTPAPEGTQAPSARQKDPAITVHHTTEATPSSVAGEAAELVIQRIISKLIATGTTPDSLSATHERPIGNLFDRVDRPSECEPPPTASLEARAEALASSRTAQESKPRGCEI